MKLLLLRLADVITQLPTEVAQISLSRGQLLDGRCVVNFSMTAQIQVNVPKSFVTTIPKAKTPDSKEAH